MSKKWISVFILGLGMGLGMLPKGSMALTLPPLPPAATPQLQALQAEAFQADTRQADSLPAGTLQSEGLQAEIPQTQPPAVAPDLSVALLPVSFWGEPFPYGYRGWGPCIRYVPVETPYGIKWRRVRVCR